MLINYHNVDTYFNIRLNREPSYFSLIFELSLIDSYIKIRKEFTSL